MNAVVFYTVITAFCLYVAHHSGPLFFFEKSLGILFRPSVRQWQRGVWL